MLKNQSFRALWGAHTVALIGTNTSLVVIPLLALSLTGATVFQMGLLEAAESLAVLLFGLFIGVYADRVGGRTAMLLANILRAAALLSIPAAYFFFTLTFLHVFAAVFVVGAGTLLYQSALSKTVVTTFDRKNWAAANSYMEGSSSVTEVGGPGLGGLLVQIIGAPFAVILDAVSYLVSSVLLFRIPSRTGEVSSKVQGDKVVQEEKANFLFGLQFILRQPVLRSITFAAAHFNFFTAVFFGVYTFYLVRELGLSPLLVGLASVAGGIGGVVSAVLAGRLMDRWPSGILFCISLILPAGAALLVPAASTSQNEWTTFALVATSQLLWSFAIVVNLVMSESIKQAVTSPNAIARVSSAIRWVTLGVEPVGAIIGGVLATILGGTATLCLAGLGLATAIIWLAPREGIRSFNLRAALAAEGNAPATADSI